MAAPGLVQSSAITTSTGSATGITLGASVASGGTLVCIVINGASTRTYTISDNQGNTWTSRVISGPTTARYVQVFSCDNAAAGSTTVTITQNASYSVYTFLLLEIDPSNFDLSSFVKTATNVTNHDCASGSGITTGTNVFLLSGGSLNANGGTLTKNASATLIGSNTFSLWQYRASDTPLTDELSRWTSTTARNNDCISVAFKARTPLNTVAPVLSGTEEEGETLSCTSGTWDSQSNGALSYQYQWTRSDDAGGTGEADISSATSATYVLTATDVGKFIRCRVRASNDGGYDSAEDTNSNMSGAIAAAGGGSIDATLSATLDGVSASATAAAKIDASLTATLEGATAASSVASLVSAGVSATLDGVTVISAATVGNAPGEATVSVSLEGVTSSATAAVTVAAGLAATLEGVSGTSAAAVLIAAGVSATLDGVLVVSTATVGNVPGQVTLSATLEGVTGFATSVVLIEAGVSATLEGATAVSSAVSLIAAGVSATLEGVTLFAMAGDGEEDDGGILLLMYRMLV